MPMPWPRPLKHFTSQTCDMCQDMWHVAMLAKLTDPNSALKPKPSESHNKQHAQRPWLDFPLRFCNHVTTCCHVLRATCNLPT
eukprot:8817160-Alexandrium_andersonii.AAC.1